MNGKASVKDGLEIKLTLNNSSRSFNHSSKRYFSFLMTSFHLCYQVEHLLPMCHTEECECVIDVRESHRVKLGELISCQSIQPVSQESHQIADVALSGQISQIAPAHSPPRAPAS